MPYELSKWVETSEALVTSDCSPPFNLRHLIPGVPITHLPYPQYLASKAFAISLTCESSPDLA